MKKYIFTVITLFFCIHLNAQNFSEYFSDKTLRLDYLFTGNAHQQNICVDELIELPGWAGRKYRLTELPLQGNGQITVKDVASQKIIYRTSFSSLFQEWLETEEAQKVTKGFENCFLIPFPLQPIEIEITLLDSKRNVRTQLAHIVDPKDILIHKKGLAHITPHRYIVKSKQTDTNSCINIAILAEGYTANEMDLFYKDAQRTCESLFNHAPFQQTKDRFNVIAVASISKDSGVSVPRLNEWKQTAFNAHFSTFYSDRYLTTSRIKAIHDALAGIPYEHIIVLANTDEYGGGGIYQSYTLTTAHHPQFPSVVVHEFGHSFGGLADEYFYDNDIMTDTYPLNIEPWEPNITTRVDFKSKWQDMLPQETPVPTSPTDSRLYPVGLYEGGGYSAKGIYRPADNCRMRTNDHPIFCLVCQRALLRMIDFYTNKP